MPAEVRSGHHGVQPSPPVVGQEAGGGPPPLLGNSLGLIGAWLVSRVSTYYRRRRILTAGLCRLCPSISMNLEEAGLTWQHGRVLQCGVCLGFSAGQVCWAVPLHADLLDVEEYFFLLILQVQLVPGIARLWRMYLPCIVLLPLGQVWWILPFFLRTHKTQPPNISSCQSTAGRSEAWRTKTKNYLLLHRKLYFLSRCGNMPLVSHQHQSTLWPCSEILKKLHHCYDLQQRCKILFEFNHAETITDDFPLFAHLEQIL